VSIDKNYQSKGYGYIHFEKDEDAKKALQEMSGYDLGEGVGNLIIREYD
jgi:RNA recognition motif-containing protein